MSATPFRTKTQFVNLLRLLVHGSRAENGSDFDAYAPDVDDMEILCHLQVPTSGVDIVWRRQNDPEVRTWNKERLFPNLRVIRPHNISGEVDEVLESPGEQFTDLLERITREVRAIAQSNGKTFGGFCDRTTFEETHEQLDRRGDHFVRPSRSTLRVAHQGGVRGRPERGHERIAPADQEDFAAPRRVLQE